MRALLSPQSTSVLTFDLSQPQRPVRLRSIFLSSSVNGLDSSLSAASSTASDCSQVRPEPRLRGGSYVFRSVASPDVAADC